MLAAFAACPVVALLATKDAKGPLRHAVAFSRFEQHVGIWSEPRLHAWTLHAPVLAAALLVFYLAVHVPATVGALTWAWLERPAAFARVRNAFLLTQSIVLTGYVLFPVAPPRMLGAPGLGDGAGVETSALARALQSPYAAFPSGHVAFAAITGGTLLVLAGAWWIRLLAALYPVLVAAVVVMSANHFWLDVIGGVVAAVLGLTGAVLLPSAGAWLLRPAVRDPPPVRRPAWGRPPLRR